MLNLRSWSVYTWIELGELFSQLILPALQRLEMSFDTSLLRTWSNTGLASLIERSQCPIRHIDLQDANILEPDLILLLTATPFLTCLIIKTKEPFPSVQDQVLKMHRQGG